MHANNEVGTLQPVAEIARMLRGRNIVLHTDAARSAGKLALSVDELGIDLLTLAGHKFYAPKGVGALYVRAGTPMRSVLHGAEQERGLRPGTENLAAIVGLGAAAAMAKAALPAASAQLRSLRDRLHEHLIGAIPGLLLRSRFKVAPIGPRIPAPANERTIASACIRFAMAEDGARTCFVVYELILLRIQRVDVFCDDHGS